MELIAGVVSDFLHVSQILVLCDSILMFKKRINGAEKYLTLVLFIIFSILIRVAAESNVYLMALEYCLFIFLLLFIVYDEPIKKLCLFSMWLMFLTALFIQMSSILVDMLFNIVSIEKTYISELVTQAITLVFVIVVCSLLQKNSKQGISIINNTYLSFFTLITIADTIVIAVLAQLINEAVKINHRIIFEIVFIVVILGVFAQMAMVLMLIVSRDIHKEKEVLMEKYLNEQKEHYEYLELREHETKKFRHDIRSHLYVLHSLYQRQDYEKFDEYLEKIDGRIDAFGNKISVNNSIVDAVLNKYQVEAEQKHIHLEVKGHFPTECSISAFDLCTIVSNLLSNAIEAAYRCGGDLVQVAFRYNEREILISVENDYDGVILFEGDVMKTRKEDMNSHGFGLESIEECVKRNGGYMNIQTENYKFKTMLLLKDGNEEAL